MRENSAKFLVELCDEVSTISFKNFRKLYSPIIGANAAFLYELLIDNYNSNYRFTPLLSFTKWSGINIETFIESRKTLEAIGLLQTFEKADNETFLLKVYSPLTPRKFFKNKLLKTEFIKNVGEIHFERTKLSFEIKETKKDEFKNISSKYHEIFNIEKIIEEKPIINDEIFNLTKEKAIKELEPHIFVQYLTKVYPNKNILSKLDSFFETELSSSSINLIINYSNDVNGKIVFRHVEKIIKSFTENRTFLFEEIEIELRNAILNKSVKFVPNKLSKQKKLKNNNLESNELTNKNLFSLFQSL
ncbi:MAG: hypothetical protein NC236_00640 [Mycoplasma sp.]|nr:hypothetical protein [Mycoplasma sp.]